MPPKEQASSAREDVWEVPHARLGGWASEVGRLLGGAGLWAGALESGVLPGRALPAVPAGVR